MDLILERANEALLPGIAVEVAVGVPEAHEVERLGAVELLIAGLQVDRGVPGGAAVAVVVAAVDVHPHAAELVDDLREPAEVDRDQVVDRDAGQLAHRVERPPRATVRVGGVDLGHVGRLPRADDLGPQVTREREQRDGLSCRIGADQHQRVGTRRRALRLVRPPVVADHERSGGLARDRDVELLRGRLHVDAVGRHGGDRLVGVEIGAAGDTHGADHDDGERPAEDAQREARAAPAWRVGLPVDRDGCSWPRRQLHLAVAVPGMTTSYASFECRPHTKRGAVRPRFRIAEASAAPRGFRGVNPR